MAGGAFADAISSDVVGYAQSDLRTGFTAVGSQFVAVGSSFDLNDLSGAGYDSSEGTDGDVSVQTLDASGNAVDIYFWVDVTDGDDIVYGWFDNDGELVERGTVSLSVGDGLWVESASDELKLQSAGKVATTDSQITLRAGFKMVANGTPVAVDLTDIYVSGYDLAEGTDGDVSVQTLDESGNAVDIYFWVDVTDGDDVVYGWFDNDGNEVEAGTVFVAPGAGLWAESSAATFMINVPGVTL